MPVCCRSELEWDIIVTKAKGNSGITVRQGPGFLVVDMSCSKISYWLGGWLEHAEEYSTHIWHSQRSIDFPFLGIGHCAPRCLLGLKRKGLAKGSHKQTLAQMWSEAAAYSLVASFLVCPTTLGYRIRRLWKNSCRESESEMGSQVKI